MGNWIIKITGNTEKTNIILRDASEMAERFVNKLAAAGHSIEKATFTDGDIIQGIFHQDNVEANIEENNNEFFTLTDELEYPD